MPMAANNGYAIIANGNRASLSDKTTMRVSIFGCCYGFRVLELFPLLLELWDECSVESCWWS